MSARGLLVALLVYCAASFVHFSHNAVYIDEYPNLPVWLTPFKVYAVWGVEAAIGLVGFLLYKRALNRRAAQKRADTTPTARATTTAGIAGLAMMAVYAALAYDGLAHYTRAPMAAHTFTMNFTIWLEVIAGTVLLAVAGAQLARTLFTGSPPLPRS